MQTSFVCCFSDAFVCLCLLSLAPAGVAICSILLATTAQHAAEEECLGDEVLPWRVPLPEFAGKQVPECRQMFLSCSERDG